MMRESVEWTHANIQERPAFLGGNTVAFKVLIPTASGVRMDPRWEAPSVNSRGSLGVQMYTMFEL